MSVTSVMELAGMVVGTARRQSTKSSNAEYFGRNSADTITGRVSMTLKVRNIVRRTHSGAQIKSPQ